MSAATRPLVLVLEGTVLGAWSVVEALAEVTVTVVAAREAWRRGAGRRGPAGHGPAAVPGPERRAPCAPLGAGVVMVGGPPRV